LLCNAVKSTHLFNLVFIRPTQVNRWDNNKLTIEKKKLTDLHHRQSWISEKTYGFGFFLIKVK